MDNRVTDYDIGTQWQLTIGDPLSSYRQDTGRGKKCPGGYSIASNKKCRTSKAGSPQKKSGLGKAALTAGAIGLTAGAVYLRKKRVGEEDNVIRRNRTYGNSLTRSFEGMSTGQARRKARKMINKVDRGLGTYKKTISKFAKGTPYQKEARQFAKTTSKSLRKATDVTRR